MMTKIDGIEVAGKISEKNQTTPNILITARLQPKEVVAGFESGANDYLKKPFSVEELVVRIRVLLSDNRLLQKSKVKKDENFSIGNILFNPHKNTIHQGIESWQLSSRESDIL